MFYLNFGTSHNEKGNCIRIYHISSNNDKKKSHVFYNSLNWIIISKIFYSLVKKRKKERFGIFSISNWFARKQRCLFVLLQGICMDWFEIDKLVFDDCQYEICPPEMSSSSYAKDAFVWKFVQYSLTTLLFWWCLGLLHSPIDFEMLVINHTHCHKSNILAMIWNMEKQSFVGSIVYKNIHSHCWRKTINRSK